MQYSLQLYGLVGIVTQLVESHPYEVVVAGSIPAGPLKGALAPLKPSMLRKDSEVIIIQNKISPGNLYKISSAITIFLQTTAIPNLNPKGLDSVWCNVT